MKIFNRDPLDIPRFSDGWTFVYTEKVSVEREQNGLVLKDAKQVISLPVAPLLVLMLGPGSTISHAAVTLAGQSGCTLVWCGDGATRFYASGADEARRSANLLHQAEVWASTQTRLGVVRRMYAMRFAEDLPDDLTIEQVRGKEGVRVRTAYARLAAETGLEWRGRSYKRDDWDSADPVNRALSAANACLYSLCHAAIVATGFSPGLGFVHTGKQLAFAYDIADLYKVDITVPIAFRAALAGGSNGIEGRARRYCRVAFHDLKLLEHIVPDIQRALGMKEDEARFVAHRTPQREDDIVDLWDPSHGPVPRDWLRPTHNRRGALLTVLIVESASVGLRGALTRWMLEVHPGVFVGTLSARVRERLWAKACASRKAGGCILVARAQTEQGFTILTHGDPRRSIIDIEGLQLVSRQVAATN